MKYAFALTAVAGLAAVANAQSTNMISEVSRDGGATWGANVNAGPGDTIYVRVRMNLVGATALGLAGATYQPTLSNWQASFTRGAFTFPGLGNDGTPGTETAYDGKMVSSDPQTNTGRIFPFGTSGQGVASASGLITSFVDGGNSLRFAGSKNTTATTNVAWGISTAQNPPSLMGTNFSSTLNAVVFRYAVTLTGGTSANLAASFTQLSGGIIKWHTQANGLNPLNSALGTTTDATINYVVPAPGALATLGLGGLAIARRRRR